MTSTDAPVTGQSLPIEDVLFSTPERVRHDGETTGRG